MSVPSYKQWDEVSLRGSVIPYGTCVTSNAAPCQCCLHQTSSFPPTLPRCGATLTLVLCMQVVSTTCPGQVGFHFWKTLPKAAREANCGLVAVLPLPCQMGRPASCPAALGMFLRCTSAALWLTLWCWHGQGQGPEWSFASLGVDVLATRPCSGVA